MSNEVQSRLFEKYRPKDLDDIIGKGNSKIVESLKKSFTSGNIPKAILFTGDTGSGKTTLARIIASKVFGDDIESMRWGISELNMSDKTGIADVRELGEASQTLSMAEKKVIIMDEVHNMSKQAQDCLLKYLEDIPAHLYWVLCTDSPEKLDKALVGRCEQFKLSKPKEEEISELLSDIMLKEGVVCDNDITLYIARSSDNTRNAIQNLEMSLRLDNITIENVMSIIKDDYNEDADWFKMIVQPLIWPFFFKEAAGSVDRVFNPEFFVPRIASVVEKYGAIELTLFVAGYCRNRILQGKYLVTSKNEKKPESKAAQEYQILLTILKQLTKVNYSYLMKPENRIVVDFIDLFHMIKPLHK